MTKIVLDLDDYYRMGPGAYTEDLVRHQLLHIGNADGSDFARWIVDEFKRQMPEPVVTFKPGDVVRVKNAPEYIFTIGAGGRFFAHSDRKWRPQHISFTSKYYELVD